MKGGMGKKQRQTALNALQSLPDHAEKALLATGRYLGEGFDDKRLDTIVFNLTNFMERDSISICRSFAQNPRRQK